MKSGKFLMAAALGLAGVLAVSAMAQPGGKPAAAQPGTEKPKAEKPKAEKPKDEKKKEAGPTVGSMAPNFTVKDLDGKEHSLATYTKEGKIVVIFWFNPDCPFVKKHFDGSSKTFNELHTKYTKDKKVVVLAVNSGATGQQGSGKERNEQAKKDWKIEFPILLDEAGTVGKAYGAKNTPATFVVDKDGKLAYAGAIDDDSSPNKTGKTNYAAKAVDELLAGKKVTTTTTSPYGCNVKYKD